MSQNRIVIIRRNPRLDGEELLAGSAYLIGGFGMTAVDGQRYGRGADPFRCRPAAWRQCWLSQIHAVPDVEPVLIAEPADRLGASSSELSKVPKGAFVL
jgi:hypothetical protein